MDLYVRETRLPLYDGDDPAPVYLSEDAARGEYAAPYRELRLTFEPDEHFSDLGDHYGEIYYESLHAPRPKGCDGAARKFWAGNDGPYWWQPPADLKSNPDALDSLYRLVQDIAAFGFSGAILTLWERDTDGDWYDSGRSASLLGLDPHTVSRYDGDSAYMQEIVSELACEIGVEVLGG